MNKHSQESGVSRESYRRFDNVVIDAGVEVVGGRRGGGGS